MLNENQQIGVGLIALGLFFFFLGVIFFFDSALIAIGNLLFVTGLVLCIGIKSTFLLFTRRDRIRGTVCMLVGLVMVLLRWGVIGVIIEGFGFLNLFWNFVPVAIMFLKQVPVLRDVLAMPFLAPVVERLGGKARPSV